MQIEIFTNFTKWDIYKSYSISYVQIVQYEIFTNCTTFIIYKYYKMEYGPGDWGPSDRVPNGTWVPSDPVFIQASPFLFIFNFFVVFNLRGVIIGHVRLGQVHCPTIVFLPLILRWLSFLNFNFLVSNNMFL
jgi:hypothetical protein